jgi:serine/threonine-protein kinase HipA
MFNYLFSNGDAHFKNFSLLETPLGDYRLSPAYDLLNSRIHINDYDFALDDGLLPKKLAQGKLSHQFSVLADQAGIAEKVFTEMLESVLSQTEAVERLTFASFMDDHTKRNYLQSYQTRLKQLQKV